MRSSIVSLCFLCSLPGCTVMEMHQDVQERESRIEVKESMLAEAQKEQKALEERRSRLVSDLKTRQMTLDDLRARLDDLQMQNRRAATASEEQKSQQRELDRKIALQKREVERQKQEIVQLEKANALSEANKRQRIETLKSEIRKQLEVGLQ